MKNCVRIKILLCCVLLIFVCSISGCGDFVYTGEHLDLYTEALHSLLGILGYEPDEIVFHPVIQILEEDVFGRKLFVYCESSHLVEGEYFLLICQSSDENSVCFYPDHNFTAVKANNFNIFNATRAEILQLFPTEIMQQLKLQNDWEKPLNADKCVKKDIVNRRSKGPVSFEKRNEAFSCLYQSSIRFKDDTECRFITTDAFGRSIYYMTCYNPSLPGYAVVFNPDGSYNQDTGSLEITEIFNYQDQLKIFKEQNNWNKPLT